MDSLKENVAYLQGLVQGLELDTSESKEARVIGSIVDALEDITDAVERLDARQSELEEYLDSMDDELLDMEDIVYGEDDEDYVEVECPECGETVCFDAGIVDDEDLIEVTCPNCDAVVFVNDGEHKVEPEGGDIQAGENTETGHVEPPIQ